MRFLKIFAACVAIVELLIYLSGNIFMDFEPSEHPFLTGVFAAFLLAFFIRVWLGRKDRIEELEKRIDALEHPDSLENKENEP